MTFVLVKFYGIALKSSLRDLTKSSCGVRCVSNSPILANPKISLDSFNFFVDSIE